jgi:hypothetical protein
MLAMQAKDWADRRLRGSLLRAMRGRGPSERKERPARLFRIAAPRAGQAHIEREKLVPMSDSASRGKGHGIRNRARNTQRPRRG